jgi:iron complex outermembrane recepter protein
MYSPASAVRVGPTIDLIGPRYVDFANTYRVGAYGLLGARAVYSGVHWQAFAEARNLLDRRYVATVAVKDRVAPGAEILFPGAPRSIYAGVRYEF